MRARDLAAAVAMIACARITHAQAAAATRTPTPAAQSAKPTPNNPSENPEDIRARLPRPTPLDTETKFPPPQQPPDKEAIESNAPGEPDKLGGERPVLLDGKPFPERRPYDPKFPDAKRTRFASAEAKDAGDGTLEHPWRDLQHALCALEPGDRLVVASGIYTGAFRAGGGACRDGSADAPIQVFARHAFLKSDGSGAVLTVEKAHWQLWEVQIALLDSAVPGLVIRGTGAHDVAIDQTHIYEGNGPALVMAAGAARVTVSNCHIHQSKGIRIEDGASEVTLVNNHIHHNRASSLTVGGGPAGSPAPRSVTVLGNRIHNDRAPGIELARCDGATIQRNRLSNYRPDEDDKTGGTAVVVGGGCRGVTFESNSIMEASAALQIGAEGPGPGPESVTVTRNYLENRLTTDATAVAVSSGRNVRIVNNVVDRYAEPFRVAAGTSGVTVANNLVIEPTVAFLLPPEPLALFAANVFGGQAGLPGRVGTGQVVASEWLAAHSPGSRVIQGVDLEEGDLGRVRGFATADAGHPVEGLAFQGRAPDVGVAEK
ncbi:MAG TPA: right-handed parallel beta-helix repeat-containing protein [Thermoanaerobaculia bacterium]|nr:right-handed parallel beta-helix repeat-containing protein [Thermoanaerobaculia bacterium]